jgi:hypothetical protein
MMLDFPRSSGISRNHADRAPGVFTKTTTGRSRVAAPWAGHWLGGHWQDLMAVLAVAAALVVIGVYAA